MQITINRVEEGNGGGGGDGGGRYHGNIKPCETVLPIKGKAKLGGASKQQREGEPFLHIIYLNGNYVTLKQIGMLPAKCKRNIHYIT